MSDDANAWTLLLLRAELQEQVNEIFSFSMSMTTMMTTTLVAQVIILEHREKKDSN